jgi:PAB-dependent poly(A)-specific ribonuclease subunit 3
MAARIEAMYHLPPPLTSAAQPEDVSGYHSLVPLESVGGNERRKSFGGYHSTVYRAVKAEDGLIWCLRRVESES